MIKSLPSHPRILFLDNLRYGIILSVVVFHAGLSYSSLVPWWPVLDSSSSRWLDAGVLLMDTFNMPVLYFIAGYFSLPALRKRTSIGLFLQSKLKRLGIPFVVFLFLAVPIIPYLTQYTRSEHFTVSPIEFWIQFAGAAVDVNRGYLRQADIFSHGHLWFVSLLLCFFLLFALVYYIKAKLMPDGNGAAGTPRPAEATRPIPFKTYVLVLIFLGGATAVASIICAQFFLHFSWLNIYNVLVFRPVRVPMYAGYFVFGIYVYWKNGLSQRSLTDFPGVWLAVSAGLSVAYLSAISAFKEIGTPYPIQTVITYHVLQSFLCLSFFCLLIALAFRFWNKASKIDQGLAGNSYNIYLVHMPVVLLLQLFFAGVDFPIHLEFALISILSMGLSYAISRYLIQPVPGWSLAGFLFGLFLLSVFW